MHSKDKALLLATFAAGAHGDDLAHVREPEREAQRPVRGLQPGRPLQVGPGQEELLPR